jgi:hypothetical protein
MLYPPSQNVYFTPNENHIALIRQIGNISKKNYQATLLKTAVSDSSFVVASFEERYFFLYNLAT